MGQLATGGARRFRRRAAALLRWHEPDESRGSSPEICEGLGVRFPGPTRRLKTLVQVQAKSSLILAWVFVFVWDVVFRNFSGSNFTLISVWSVFNSVNNFGLEGLAFLHQFFHALGIDIFISAQSLNIARLPPGNRSQAAAALSDHTGIHFAGAARGSSGIAANGTLRANMLFAANWLLLGCGLLSCGRFLHRPFPRNCPLAAFLFCWHGKSLSLPNLANNVRPSSMAAVKMPHCA